MRRPWSTASTAALHTPAVPSRVPLSVGLARGCYGSSVRCRSRHTFTCYDISSRQPVVTVTFHDVTDASDESTNRMADPNIAREKTRHNVYRRRNMGRLGNEYPNVCGGQHEAFLPLRFPRHQLWLAVYWKLSTLSHHHV